MAFTHRSIAESDVERCLSLTRESFAFAPADSRAFAPLWKELLATDGCISVAIEDRRLDARHRVVGFGMSVFVTDAFAGQVLAGAPFLSHAFLKAWRTGDRPWLNKKEIAEANAGAGLNLLVLHYGWDEARLTPDELRKVRLMQTNCFLQHHAGYKTREYLHEVFGPVLREFVLSAGCVLRHDYRERKWAPLLKGIAEADWPYLTGFRPEEALAKAGTAASLFHAKEVTPRFAFSAGEIVMLAMALEGNTEPEMARRLGLSPWTIKKRWQAVYLKVEAANPALLPAARPSMEKSEDRQPQRRRHLLEYLRQHPEEIRPRATKARSRS